MGKPLISAFTSVNKGKVPALFTYAAFAELIKPGCAILDYGCGRWPEVAADFARNAGAARVDSFDPYWFPNANYVPIEGYDLVCLSNVLNVIQEKKDRLTALKAAWDALKPGGRMLVTVYEGDASGASGPSKDGCWQERRKLRSYMDDELACYFGVTVAGTGGRLWSSLPKPAKGEKWYPPIGTRLTLCYFTGSETPYTVVGVRAGKLAIRRCELVFHGPRYPDTLPDEIREGAPNKGEEELVWRPKSGDWHGKGRYGGWVRWGRWSYQPYLD